MSRRITPAKIGILLICFLIIVIAGKYGPLSSYIQQDKSTITNAYSSSIIKNEDNLLSYIKTEAEKLNKPPIDAVVDRIWKAIPGYNGVVVDIQATYHKAKLLGLHSEDSQAIPWIYHEVKPKISLEDLPLQPLYRGNPSKPMVAFMINVAWGDEYLTPMLDILKEKHVKATFFLDGTWLSKNKNMALTILGQGHELSNHAYSHPNMSRLSHARQREEIAKTEALIKDLGVHNKWFAPPSGDYDARTVSIASELGLRTVLWTLDTVDWMKPEPSSIIVKVSKRVEAGHLILMHPTSSSQRALIGMIEAIRAKGFSLGTVSETLSPNRA